MDTRDNLLEQLRSMLHWKKSKAYYAQRLAVSEEEIQELFNAINNTTTTTSPLSNTSFSYNAQTGRAEQVVETAEEIRNLSDLIRVCKIDTNLWNIDRYVQNFWGNSEDPRWQVKVWLSPKNESQEYTDKFIEFLSQYRPAHTFIPHQVSEQPKACLILNKQDAHLNKFDVEGNNSLLQRFSELEQGFRRMLLQATLGNALKEIVYLIGSDEFNSEWTSMTTMGTPQQNIEDYHGSFEQICEHEIRIINELLLYGETVIIKFIPGNHDEYVGWHMIKWLQCYYRQQPNLIFETDPSYTKAHHFSNTAMLFNHGDAQKPEKLAQDFPVNYKDIWAKSDHYYIFVGDKHHLLGKDIASIEFYQIPSLSKAKSKWDLKKGHTATRAQMFAFLIEEGVGMSTIYKKKL